MKCRNREKVYVRRPVSRRRRVPPLKKKTFFVVLIAVRSSSLHIFKLRIYVCKRENSDWARSIQYGGSNPSMKRDKDRGGGENKCHLGNQKKKRGRSF